MKNLSVIFHDVWKEENVESENEINLCDCEEVLGGSEFLTTLINERSWQQSLFKKKMTAKFIQTEIKQKCFSFDSKPSGNAG